MSSGIKERVIKQLHRCEFGFPLQPVQGCLMFRAVLIFGRMGPRKGLGTPGSQFSQFDGIGRN